MKSRGWCLSTRGIDSSDRVFWALWPIGDATIGRSVVTPATSNAD